MTAQLLPSAHRCSARIPGIALLALTVAAASGCDRGAADAERKARDEAMAKLVQQARDEERDKDRRMREQAMKDAERLMPQEPTADASRPAADAAIVDTAANTSTRQEQGAAPFLARLKATLVDPESMQIRDLSLRENASVLCVEINARNRAGDYIGYTPVIVTGDRVLFYPFARDVFDARQPTAAPEFLIMNERVRCWAVESAKK